MISSDGDPTPHDPADTNALWPPANRTSVVIWPLATLPCPAANSGFPPSQRTANSSDWAASGSTKP
jgi:hypothetical protein